MVLSSTHYLKSIEGDLLEQYEEEIIESGITKGSIAFFVKCVAIFQTCDPFAIRFLDET